MAIPSSWILEKIGFKKGMALGLFIMAVGSLIFIPAANTRIYALFLLGLFVQGLGLAILQTASNPYVTILGPIESAAKRISVMGVANKFAGILSPVILGIMVLEGIDDLQIDLATMDISQKVAELNALAHKVILPYAIMAIVLILLSGLIIYSPLPSIDDQDSSSEHMSTIQKIKAVVKVPYLTLGFVAIFCYLGVEVIPVDTMKLYGEYLGFSSDQTKFFASFTLVAMLIGYLFGIIAIPKYISQQKALKYFTYLGMIFTVVAVFANGIISIIFIVSLGFANSIMWPAIWPLAIDGLGKFTKIGSAILIMGIVGAAILTPFFGQISTWLGNMQMAYLILIPCYLYILFYATKGHKIGKRQTQV
jgi:glucose/galactose transporter